MLPQLMMLMVPLLMMPMVLLLLVMNIPTMMNMPMMMKLLLTHMLPQLMMHMVPLLMMPMVLLLEMNMPTMMNMPMMMKQLMTPMLPQEMLLSMKLVERLAADFHPVDVEDVPDLCPTADGQPEDPTTDAQPGLPREVLDRREDVDVDVDSSPSPYLTVAPPETDCWPSRPPAPREAKQDCKLSVDLGMLCLALINHSFLPRVV